MKLGMLTVPLYSKSLDETLKYLSGLGVQCVEIGAGGSPGSKHLDVEGILESDAKAQEVLDCLAKYNMSISAISVHDNAVHPDPEYAKRAHRDFINGTKVAKKLGVDTVVTFSGCPGDHLGSKAPNWVTCLWPEIYGDILKYQWDEVLIPYWQKAVKEAADNGITKIALEMHPGFCVYNPSTLQKLRAAAGDAIGANFDPSHLFWQGVDPVDAIRNLKDCIFHFHAKDTALNTSNVKVNGVLDTVNRTSFADRAFMFRTVGYGNNESMWRNIVSALKAIGYKGPLSIEHEDALMSVREGIEKAVAFLKDIIIYEEPAESWWE